MNTELNKVIIEFIQSIIKYLDNLRHHYQIQETFEIIVRNILIVSQNEYSTIIELLGPSLALSPEHIKPLIPGVGLLNVEFNNNQIYLHFKLIPYLPDEIWLEIGKWIDNGGSWKTFGLINREIRQAIQPLQEEKVAELSNHLWTLIKMFPNWGWNWRVISGNPNTTLKIIESLPQYFVEWNNFDEFNFPHWDWIGLSYNPNLTETFVSKYFKHKTYYNDFPYGFIIWGNIAKNPNISFEFLREKTHDNFRILSYSINLPLSFVFQNLDREWDWNRLSSNPNITPDLILLTLDKPWQYHEVTSNKAITWDIIQKYPNIPWDITSFSKNPNLTWDIVKNNLNSFYPESVSFNPSITPDIIENNPSYPWYWVGLSENPNTTLEFVLRHIYEKWNWDTLSFHENITYEMVIKNPQVPWRFETMVWNPNLTWVIIKNNPKLWVWQFLSENKFRKHKKFLK